MSKFLGTLSVPLFSSLPGTGTVGQIIALQSTGQLYAWVNTAWMALGSAVQVTVGTVVVDFGSTGSMDAYVNVSVPSVTAASVPNAVIQATATADHSADEHRVEDLIITVGNISAGIGFTIYAQSNTVQLRGKFNVSWSTT